MITFVGVANTPLFILLLSSKYKSVTFGCNIVLYRIYICKINHATTRIMYISHVVTKLMGEQPLQHSEQT